MERKGRQSKNIFLRQKNTLSNKQTIRQTHAQAIRQTHRRESFASAPITSGGTNTDTCTKRTDLGHPQRRAAAADGGTDDGHAHLTQRQEGGGGGHQPDEVAVVQGVSLKTATTC